MIWKASLVISAAWTQNKELALSTAHSYEQLTGQSDRILLMLPQPRTCYLKKDARPALQPAT
jgi:hypothetical protein